MKHRVEQLHASLLLFHESLDSVLLDVAQIRYDSLWRRAGGQILQLLILLITLELRARDVRALSTDFETSLLDTTGYEGAGRALVGKIWTSVSRTPRGSCRIVPWAQAAVQATYADRRVSPQTSFCLFHCPASISYLHDLPYATSSHCLSLTGSSHSRGSHN